MADSKYSKYIVTDLKKDIPMPGSTTGEMLPVLEPGQRRRMSHVIWMDSDIVPGAFYSECVWFFPENMINVPLLNQGTGPAPHTHPFSEIISFFGTNRDDPTDLGAEVELWLEDRKYVMTKSFICYVPAEVKHCPLKLSNIRRPVFHITMGPGRQYLKTQEDQGSEEQRKGNYDKHFITQDKPNLKLPEFRHEIPKERAYRIVYLDGEVVPGADFYCECLWFWPRKVEPDAKPDVPEHTHPFDEMIAFFGTNPDDIYDLGGEVELWIDGEKNVINRSFIAFIPAGTRHGPLRITRIDRPVFHFTAGPGSVYS